MMRFEVNTDVQKISEVNFWVILFGLITFIIFLTDLSLNLRKMARNFEIDYLCKIILVDKKSSNLRKLYRLTGLKNKQQVRELCQEFK